ncbi:hypothetical protein NKDENANG_03880 [Candidatus Entotheonellaceae bacterium PAL068K]
MCILMVAYRRVRAYPIVLAANRDEFLDRPAQEPDLLGSYPAIWGGRDVRVGGTWLGVNAHGLVVGLTNRRTNPKQENDPSRRSRGLLCLDALHYSTADEVVLWLCQQSPDRYNPFNLLIADQQVAYWIAYERTSQTHRLEPGLHILANGDLNNVGTVRIRRARHLLQHSKYADLQTLLPFLEGVCGDHEIGVQDRETICMHHPQDHYGTVSSTILALSPDLPVSVYRYAAGQPCVTPYKDYSALLAAASIV